MGPCARYSAFRDKCLQIVDNTCTIIRRKCLFVECQLFCVCRAIYSVLKSAANRRASSGGGEGRGSETSRFRTAAVPLWDGRGRRSNHRVCIKICVYVYNNIYIYIQYTVVRTDQSGNPRRRYKRRGVNVKYACRDAGTTGADSPTEMRFYGVHAPAEKRVTVKWVQFDLYK